MMIWNNKYSQFIKGMEMKGLKRQFLHAKYLKFSLPDGKVIELESKLPKELKLIL